jgi:hypothetical protein
LNAIGGLDGSTKEIWFEPSIGDHPSAMVFPASRGFRSCELLDSHEYLPQHLACCTSGLRGNRPLDSQALAPDHVVKTPRSRRGHDLTSFDMTSCEATSFDTTSCEATSRSVRRITFGEEHDATGKVASTLPKDKVTAQVRVIRSC